MNKEFGLNVKTVVDEFTFSGKRKKQPKKKTKKGVNNYYIMV